MAKLTPLILDETPCDLGVTSSSHLFGCCSLKDSLRDHIAQSVAFRSGMNDYFPRAPAEFMKGIDSSKFGFDDMMWS